MSSLSVGPKQAGLERFDATEFGNVEDPAAHGRDTTRSGAVNSARRVELRGYFYLSLMVLVGSTTSPLAMVAVRQLPVGILPLLRFGFAGLCLIPFLSDRDALKRLLRQDLFRLTFVAACCVPINQSFFLNATRFGPNSHVGLFYAVCPLVVWVLAWALGHEALNLRRLWGVLVSMAGVGIIGLGNLWGSSTASPAEIRSIMIADLLLVGAVISWGAYLTLSKPLVARYGALPVLVGTFLVGCLLELPIAAVTLPGSLPSLGRARAAAWISLAVLALLITPLNLALQNLSLRRLDATQVATFTNAAPLLTVLWGVWFFHEVLTPSLIFGGFLTLGGIVWSSRPGPRSLV